MGNVPLSSAVIEITNRCNLRCPFCYSASGCARPDELSLDELKAAIHDLKSFGCERCAILGGEFLLRKDWYEIADEIRSTGMALQLLTNGLLVTDEIRRQFKALEPQAVGVSLDGATPETYKLARGVDGYAKVRKVIDDLVSDGINQVSAITTFNAKTLQDFDLFVKMFIDTPVVWEVQMAHKLSARFPGDLLMSREQYVWFVDKVTEALYTLHDRLKIATKDDFGYFPMTPKLRFLCNQWNGCHAGVHSVGIRANGDVVPCLMLGEHFVEDNLRRRPLAEIWNDPNSFARFRHKEAHLTGVCAKCPFGSRCKAGCSAMAISQSGTLTETPFCIRQLETERIIREMTE